MSNVIIYDATKAKYQSPPSPDEVKELYNVLSFQVVGAEFSPQAQKFVFDPRKGGMVYNKRYNGWDGIKRLYNKKTHTFPIGLIHRALDVTPNVKLVPLIVSIDRKPLDSFIDSLKYKPYRHQITAFEKLTERGHGMVELPTASGKSLIIAMLAMAMKHGIGLITVPSKYLLHQTKRDIENLTNNQIELGIYGDGICELKPITIATVQSVYSGIQSKSEILAWLREVQWWVSDETHGAAADSWQDISKEMIQAGVRYGLTATLKREDNAELLIEGVIGPLVYRESPLDLIQEGILATPEVEIHWFDAGNIVYNAEKPKYNTVYKACVTQNKERNKKILEQCHRAIHENMTPALVIVDEVEHGKILSDLLNKNGILTENLDGSDSSDERSEAVSKLLGGQYKILVASGIFNTGINIPPIRTVINAAAGKSEVEAIQRAGRVLRTSQSTGKLKGRLIDFYDDEPKYLRKHARQRRLIYMTTYRGYVLDYTQDGELDTL